jgi:threonine/homoserine/homoserine lactone efflux protein
MNPQPPAHSWRGTFLGIVLAVGAVAAFLIVVVVVLSPFLMQALAALVIVVGLVGLGCFHYWTWGRAFSRQVEEERQAEEGTPPWRDESFYERRF